MKQQQTTRSMQRTLAGRQSVKAGWLKLGGALLLAAAQSVAMAGQTAAADGSGEFLAEWDGLASYCSRLDPARRADYKGSVKKLFAQARGSDLDKARSTPAYEQRLQAIVAELKKQDGTTAANTCAGLIQASR